MLQSEGCGGVVALSRLRAVPSLPLRLYRPPDPASPPPPAALPSLALPCCSKSEQINSDPNSALGSLPYTAPEVLSNTMRHGHQADVWSLGVALYKMCVGLYPFERLIDATDSRTAVQVSPGGRRGAGGQGWPDMRLGRGGACLCVRVFGRGSRRKASHQPPASQPPTSQQPGTYTPTRRSAPPHSLCPAT